MPATDLPIPDTCPDILKAWLATHDNDRHRAAKTLGVTVDSFGKWIRGNQPLPERRRTQMEQMMAAKKPPTPPPPPADDELATRMAAVRAHYPNTEVPDDVIELVARCGNASRAAGRAGIPNPDLHNALLNKTRITPLNAGRITRTLPVVRNEEMKNFTTGTTARGKGKSSIPLDVYPPLLQELIKKHNGVLIDAALALGHRTAQWITRVRKGDTPFDEVAQRRVRAAIDGEIVAPIPTRRHADDFDRCELGIAIVLAPHNATEAIYDAGEAMGGRWIFRKKLDADWLIICKLDDDKLAPFKAVVRLVAKEVVTP